MLFILTPNGGPMQYVGVVLLFLQLIVPQLLIWLDDDSGSYYTRSFPAGTRSLSLEHNHQQQWQSPLSQVSRTDPPENVDHPRDRMVMEEADGPHFPFGLILTTVLFVMILMYFSDRINSNNNATDTPENIPPPQREQRDQRQQEQQQRDPNILPEGPNSAFERFQNRMVRFRDVLGERIEERTGLVMNDFRVSFVAGLGAGMILMSVALIVDYCRRQVHYIGGGSRIEDDQGSFFSASTLLYWLPYVHQFMGLAALGFELCRRGRWMGMTGQPFGVDARTFTRQQQEAKMNRMVELVHKVPLENFIAQNEETQDGQMDEGEPAADYSPASISQLKQMLLRRGVPQVEIDSYVDRSNMVDRLKKCRQYSGSCCICFEPYQEGDPIRVLPKCHHELHVDCLDKWVYTFANNPSKLQHEPSCPLCKEGLTCES